MLVCFDVHCDSLRIEVEHPIPYVHTQNGLAESLIKCIQIIIWTLFLKTKLTSSAWGHVVLYVVALIRLYPIVLHLQSFLQLVHGYKPNISHLYTFWCVVRVPIASSQRTKMSPQRQLSIYIGYNSPSIIRFLKPSTDDLFIARFVDCHFDEIEFPSLGIPKASKDEKQKKIDTFSWNKKVYPT